ncbi:MAG: SGNH/GDSL hydrolase family protein, partial [Anaerolineales bacterium]
LPLWMSACQSPATPPPMPDSRQTIRYLALGDSYTIGESVPESDRWPVQLIRLIETSPQFEQMGGTQGGINLTLIARTGWTTDELWAAIQQRGVEPPYDLVSLLIGVNNQYRGRSLDAYREDFRFLLGKAIEYAGGDPGRVIVLSIPDWSVTPFARFDPRTPGQIAAEIDAFNAVNREETEKAGARYIDITPGSRDARTDSTLIAEDGLHPSAAMYAQWAQAALPAALQALGLAP